MQSTKIAPFSNLQAALDRQVQYGTIMCAGMDDREFKEKNINRDKTGQFSTAAEKAAKAKAIADANAAALADAPPGMVKLPDGTETYKMSPEENKGIASSIAASTAELGKAIAKAAADPAGAIADLEQNLQKLGANALAAVGKTPAAKATAVAATASAKATAVAQTTKAVASNLSEDEVRKGMVAVSKQLNSGEPAKPGDTMQMLKDFAAQAQANINKNIKKVKTAASEGKEKALAAGMGLMAKISETANNPFLKELGSAAVIGYAQTAVPRLAGGAIGGALAGPAGAMLGSSIGATVGAGLAGVNIAKGALSRDPAYYQKELAAIGGSLNKAKDKIGSSLSNLKNQASESIKDGAQVVGDNLLDAKEGAQSQLKKLGDGASKLKDQASQAAAKGASDLKDGAGSNLSKLGDEANKLKDEIGNSAAAESIKDGAQVAGDTLLDAKEGAQSQLKKLGDGASKLKDQASQAAAKGASDLKDGASSNLSKLGNEANKLKDKIGNSAAAESIKDGAQVAGDTLLDAKEGAQSQLKKLGDGASKLKEQASQAAAKGASDLKDGASSNLSKLGNEANKLKDKIGNSAAASEPTIKPKYQIGDTAASVGKNLDRAKNNAGAAIGEIGKNASKVLPSKDEIVGAYQDLARGAVKTGLPASIAGGLVGGFAGGSMAGPAGYVAGVEIGRDVGGLVGTGAGMIGSFLDRNGKPVKKDTSEPGIYKVGRAADKLGKMLPGVADTARSQGANALQNLAEGAKAAVANRKIDTSEPGIYGVGRAASAVASNLQQKTNGLVENAKTAAAQKVESVLKDNAASRAEQAQAQAVARQRAAAAAAAEREQIARSAAAGVPQPADRGRQDTNPTTEALSSFASGIGSKVGELTKGLKSLVKTNPNPKLAAAVAKAQAAARSEKANINTSALDRVNQATVKQAALQKKARENAEKMAKSQRLAQQTQALKQLNERLAKA